MIFQKFERVQLLLLLLLFLFLFSFFSIIIITMYQDLSQTQGLSRIIGRTTVRGTPPNKQ